MNAITLPLLVLISDKTVSNMFLLSEISDTMLAPSWKKVISHCQISKETLK
jgi:hypothetical protein